MTKKYLKLNDENCTKNLDEYFEQLEFKETELK